MSFINPDNKVHGANMGPTWVLSAPDGPHVDPITLAIWEGINLYTSYGSLKFLTYSDYSWGAFDMLLDCM